MAQKELHAPPTALPSVLRAVPDIVYQVIHVLKINANVRMAVVQQVPIALSTTKQSVLLVATGSTYQRFHV